MLGDLESVVHKHRPSREQDLVQRSMCFSISAPYFPFIFIYLLREPFSCLFTHPFSAFFFSFHLQDLYSIVIDSFVFFVVPIIIAFTIHLLLNQTHTFLLLLPL